MMKIIRKYKKKEKKISPFKQKDIDTDFVEAQLLVAKSRAYAVVYGCQKDGKD